MNNIIDILKVEHREADTLFEQIEQTEGATALNLFRKLTDMLEIHTTSEEEVVYNAAEHKSEVSSLIDHAYKEHDEIRFYLDELSHLTPEEGAWKVKLAKLKKAVQHHVKEEEEKMFPQMEKIYTESQLESMAEEFKDIKNRFSKAS